MQEKKKSAGPKKKVRRRQRRGDEEEERPTQKKRKRKQPKPKPVEPDLESMTPEEGELMLLCPSEDYDAFFDNLFLVLYSEETAD